MFTTKEPKWVGRQSSTKVRKYNCSKANLRRLEAFLFMHYEGLQQPSLTQGSWLLKTASHQPLHKSCLATLGDHLRWAAKLRAHGGELEEGAI